MNYTKVAMAPGFYSCDTEHGDTDVAPCLKYSINWIYN